MSRAELGFSLLGNGRIQAWVLLQEKRTLCRTKFPLYGFDGCSEWWSAWWQTTDLIWCVCPATLNWNLLALIALPFKSHRGTCLQKCFLPLLSARKTQLLRLSLLHLLVVEVVWWPWQSIAPPFYLGILWILTSPVLPFVCVDPLCPVAPLRSVVPCASLHLLGWYDPCLSLIAAFFQVISACCLKLSAENVGNGLVEIESGLAVVVGKVPAYPSEIFCPETWEKDDCSVYFWASNAVRLWRGGRGLWFRHFSVGYT